MKQHKIKVEDTIVRKQYTIKNNKKIVILNMTNII